MTDKIAKYLINDPAAIIDEAIAGMVSAHPGMLEVIGATGRAVVAKDGPREGKVGIVIGGGSGHEPAFAGYVGRGLADAAAVGNVFASPSPEQIADAARAVDGGAGVLFLYGNYTGDVLNFDMAAELVAKQGIETRSFAVADDVASAPKGRENERRGVAGDFFVFKIAGAAAERGDDLDACHRLACKANDLTRSMGVALSACALPQTGKPNFAIGDRDMEIGMGLHGEPGIRREELANADSVTDILMQGCVEELGLTAGDRVAVLVNGLGATGLLELYVLHRRLAENLAAMSVGIHHSWVGEYATSLDMSGASITLMKLDEEMTTLLDAPCRTPALTVAGDLAPAANAARVRRDHAAISQARRQNRTTLARGGAVDPGLFRKMMLACADSIAAHEGYLSKLDGVIGDGDHGVTMNIGWTAIREFLADTASDLTISELCDGMADAFLNAVGASSGPLYASAFRAAADRVRDRLNLDAAAMARLIDGMRAGIAERGGAKQGDKTMMDAWIPAAKAAGDAHAAGASELSILRAATDGAARGRDATADMESRRGRSAKLGTRSLGHIDPGAASTHLILDAMAEALSEVVTGE
ncbi:dihydroxyacetone kinase subunit DhaL [Paracoccus sp. Z330]|uniref:Dihydroxyacetone kinase subunit DhaL n=1 Tax=Paracoccus onchidii TaxID=3017813 RepID=A0ABT4ZHK3_9RHOB|nr:dihydroxyacetone kinase subunit DhaL [Paracoccus onchidii]MDB6178463.1 dihydroxyacetone kinase subunit DhaL [Paracoccus onchidii]